MANAQKTPKSAVEVKTVEQLQEDLVKLQHDQLEAKKSHRQGELINPHMLTIHRKNIARLHTAIKQAQSSALTTEEEK